MKNNYKIEKSNYDEKPFPHISKDNFLDTSLLNDINENWPGDNFFFDEITGIRLLDLEYSVKTNKIFSILKIILKRDLNAFYHCYFHLDPQDELEKFKAGLSFNKNHKSLQSGLFFNCVSLGTEK